jgi:hypothetical protein
MANHNCLDHLVLRSSDSVETHGLDCGPYEQVHEEWNECRVCHETYTDSEATRMWEQEEALSR